jgi:tetratricopeptide (TPR) repeat protein
MPAAMDTQQARARGVEGRRANNSRRYQTANPRCYDAAGSAQVRAVALTCMGEAEFARGNYQKAIALGRRAHGMKPGTAVYLLLSNAYFKKGNCHEAAGYATKVLTGPDSSNPEAQRVLELCGRRQ